jgi:hypothetical protein
MRTPRRCRQGSDQVDSVGCAVIQVGRPASYRAHEPSESGAVLEPHGQGLPVRLTVRGITSPQFVAVVPSRAS